MYYFDDLHIMKAKNYFLYAINSFFIMSLVVKQVNYYLIGGELPILLNMSENMTYTMCKMRLGNGIILMNMAMKPNQKSNNLECTW